MKRILLTIALALTGISQLHAQDCGSLFFSEYVEGSYNNKAMAIYNPTNQTINLSGYKIIRWSNGNANYDPSYAVTLSGTIAPKDEFVVVLDKQDCSLSGQDTCVFQGLKDKADLYVSPNYATNPCLYHNGDDALSLNLTDAANGGAGTFVDIFGFIGEDPGTSWTDVFPYTDSAGGAYWTKDQTCIRKPTVKQGRASQTGSPLSGAWNPTAEWDTLPINTFDHLGYHVCDCGSTGINTNSVKTASVTMFPNPAQASGKTFVLAQSAIETVEIYNLSGQLLETVAGDGYTQMAIDLNKLPAGTYMVQTKLRNGDATLPNKLVVQ